MMLVNSEISCLLIVQLLIIFCGRVDVRGWVKKMAEGSDNALVPSTRLYCESEDHIVSISTHPSQDILAVGDIGGKITLYVYVSCAGRP